MHDAHRGLMARVFTPKKMSSIEPPDCAFSPGSSTLSMACRRLRLVQDLGSHMAMRIIGMLLGIPEDDQRAIKEQSDRGLKLEAGEEPRHRGVDRSESQHVRATTSTGAQSTRPAT